MRGCERARVRVLDPSYVLKPPPAFEGEGTAPTARPPEPSGPFRVLRQWGRKLKPGCMDSLSTGTAAQPDAAAVRASQAALKAARERAQLRLWRRSTA